MKSNETIYSSRGSVAVNIVLIIVLVFIAMVIYKLVNVSRVAPVEQTVFGVETVARQRPQSPSARGPECVFSDGLSNPTSSTNFAPDDLGAGVTNISVFEYDINSDGRNDRITRTHVETGAAHFYDEYKLELNRGNGEYIDVTPKNFRTSGGADCALDKIKFEFTPNFRVIRISRPWRDTWDTPTAAVRTVYALSNGEMIPVGKSDMGVVCDVSQLF